MKPPREARPERAGAPPPPEPPAIMRNSRLSWSSSAAMPESGPPSRPAGEPPASAGRAPEREPRQPGAQRPDPETDIASLPDSVFDRGNVEIIEDDR